MDTQKNKVAAIADYYIPGFRAGGPIDSLSRIIEQANTCTFKVITRDRDLGQNEPYLNFSRHVEKPMGRARVLQIRGTVHDWLWVRKKIIYWQPDSYYLNSVHSVFGTILPLVFMRLRLLPKARHLVIAPRGEFGNSALSMKESKKRFFRPLIKLLIPRNVIWHGSSEEEVAQIKAWWGNRSPIGHLFVVAPDPAEQPDEEASTGPSHETVFVFASRIDRMKGLDRANDIIKLAGQEISLTWSVQGSVTDEEYLRELKEQCNGLPPNVSLLWNGSFDPTSSKRIFSNATAFIFPTLGENFGHVVGEALAVGCPIFITPVTPWTELVLNGAGTVIESNEQAAIELVRLASLRPWERLVLRKQVLELYRDWFEQQKHLNNPFTYIFTDD